jgi:hypothetical protein
MHSHWLIVFSQSTNPGRGLESADLSGNRVRGKRPPAVHSFEAPNPGHPRLGILQGSKMVSLDKAQEAALGAKSEVPHAR